MKTQSYGDFWQQIHNTAKEKRFPLRVMFELTYRCNFKCKHCYQPPSYRKKGELKTKKVFSILGQLKDMGCFYLGFTGGEPFIRKDIIDILWHAKKKGFQLIIYSNGSLINEEIAGELQRLRPNKVDITIPAMGKDAFERISGVVGSGDRVFKTIDILHKKGVKLGFKTCVLKENASEIKKIEDFAVSLGAPHRLDDMLFPCLDGSKEPYRYRGRLGDNLVVSRKSQVASKKEPIDCNLETTHQAPSTKHRTPITENLFQCGVGRSHAAITPLGELKMCLMIDYPKYRILETNLKECWMRLREFKASIQPDRNYKCHRCGLRAYCKWCPARAWLYNRSFTFCEPESRRKAELTRQ